MLLAADIVDSLEPLFLKIQIYNFAFSEVDFNIIKYNTGFGFSKASDVVPGMSVLFCRSVGPRLWPVTVMIGLEAVKFSSDIHILLRLNCIYLGDTLNPQLMPSRAFSFSSSLAYDQIPVKLRRFSSCV